MLTAWTGETRSRRGLLEAILKPFLEWSLVDIAVKDVLVGRAAVTPLVFYELCTNSAKYGALPQEAGRLTISSKRQGDRLIIHWEETFSPMQASPTVQGRGFGMVMCELALQDQLDGSF